MRRLTLLLALVATTTLLAAGVALTQTQPATGDADPYIVVLNDNVESPSQVASEIDQRQNLDVGFVYNDALEGFSAEIPDGKVAAVRANPRVDYVERDIPMHAVAQRLPWGVDRIQADKSSTKADNGTGAVSNVNVYVIDTGIYRHADLNVVKHVNRTGDGRNTDCNGHGTHVAGTLAARDNASSVVGVAPGAPLTGVKVLDCKGGGDASTVIAGIEWVTAKARKPAVANMSISSEVGQASQAVDDAVTRSAESRVFYSIAAGNFSQDACNFSPARVGAGTNNGIVTTAATNMAGEEASFSNYGSCVDIWAPGINIPSTRMEGGTERLDGTSMASPHVGGAAALYLSSHTKATPTRVERVLKEDSKLTGSTSKDTRPIQRVHAGGY